MKNVKKIKLPGISSFDLFLTISLSITGLFVIFNIFTGGALFEKCVMSSSYLFSDYFYHIAGSSNTALMYSYGDPYSFPPFAYFMYSLLWSLNPYRDNESILNWQNYRNADNAMLVFVIYNMLVMVLLIYCIRQYFNENKAKYTLLLPTSLLFSYPLLCTAIQRGNVILLAAIFLALAWFFMDSESRVKRELALILIAAASGFKLYPALTGLVYIRRKKWKEAARLVLYGLITVFVPFIFYGGGQGMKDLFHTLTGFVSSIDPEKVNTVCGMAKWFGMKLGMGEALADTFGGVMDCLFFAAAILFFFLSKRKWQEALFLNAVLVSFLPSNWQYTLVYYLPVLFLFIKEYDKDLKQYGRKENIWIIFHSVAFAMIFSMDFFMLYYRYGLVSGIFTLTYLIFGVNMVSVLTETVKRYRSRGGEQIKPDKMEINIEID